MSNLQKQVNPHFEFFIIDGWIPIKSEQVFTHTVPAIIQDQCEPHVVQIYEFHIHVFHTQCVNQRDSIHDCEIHGSNTAFFCISATTETRIRI
jgi:hypothetical protein